MKKEIANVFRKKAIELYNKAHIVLNPEEQKNIELVDLGLNEFEKTGLSIVVYINTDYYCAKEMALLPNQTCPEHTHRPMRKIGYMGKQETFRCRYGKIYLYVEGKSSSNPVCKPPLGSEKYYTVWHEIVLNPANSILLHPIRFIGFKPEKKAP